MTNRENAGALPPTQTYRRLVIPALPLAGAKGGRLPFHDEHCVEHERLDMVEGGSGRAVLPAAASVHYANIVQATAAAVGALASIAIVVLAVLFREEVRAARLRPVLQMAFDPLSSDKLRIGDPPYVEFWIRFRVRNASGKDTARAVQLLLLNVRSAEATRSLPDSAPNRPFQVGDTHETSIDIASNAERRFDILYLERQEPHSSHPSVILALQPRSKSGRDLLGVGTHQLYLALLLENGDASYWYTEAVIKKLPLPGDDLSTVVEMSYPQQLGGPPVL